MPFPEKHEGRWVVWTLEGKCLQPGIIRKTDEVCETLPNEIGGASCAICTYFIQYAEPNMSDDTFVCFSCRDTKGWMIPDNVYYLGS